MNMTFISLSEVEKKQQKNKKKNTKKTKSWVAKPTNEIYHFFTFRDEISYIHDPPKFSFYYIQISIVFNVAQHGIGV